MEKVIEGKLSAEGMRFGVVVSRFNSFVTEPLLAGAMDAIVRHGGSREQVTVVRVPGSFETPLACQALAESKSVDAVVALGAVIRGSTTHYDLVCSEAAKGVATVSLKTGVPVAFGIITCENLEQAIERAGSKAGNKGADAALAAIEMVQVLKAVKKQ